MQYMALIQAVRLWKRSHTDTYTHTNEKETTLQRYSTTTQAKGTIFPETEENKFLNWKFWILKFYLWDQDDLIFDFDSLGF